MNLSSPEVILPSGFEYVRKEYEEFLTYHPHVDRNVFVMMPFSTSASEALFESIAAQLNHHGLLALRADRRAFSKSLWANVVTYMLGSSYGVVVYEPSDTVSFNPNVSIEAGFMVALDRPVLFLVNERLQGLPTDLAGTLYKPYDSDKVAMPSSVGGSPRAAVRDWCEGDLSYYPYETDDKLILFLSLGGTSRCVMGKAILADLFHKNELTGVTADAACVSDPKDTSIDQSALKAIHETGRARWVAKHRPRKLCPYLQTRAKLIILLTDRTLVRRDTEHQGRIVSDLELFDEIIPDPSPDNGDEESLRRYRQVLDHLEHLIDKKFDQILDLAEARPSI